MKDQLGRAVILREPPQRIVSLVPSQTELLFDLGLEDKVVGITKFCTWPEEWKKKKQIVGGTKTLNLDVIRSLRPDLIIGNKEENDAAQINELMGEFSVWMSDIYTLGDALDMIRAVGLITGKELESEIIAGRIEDVFNRLEREQSGHERIAILYFIWKEPLMVAGNSTFIHDILRRAGFLNLAGNLERYPEMQDETICALRPPLFLLSSEPYPFRTSHLKEFKTRFPGSESLLVNGEFFSWYGSRLLQAPSYLSEIHTQASRLLKGFEGKRP